MCLVAWFHTNFPLNNYCTDVYFADYDVLVYGRHYICLACLQTVRFKSYLLSLGISDPVTRDQHSSSDKYHRELAKEISRILETPLKVGERMNTIWYNVSERMSTKWCHVSGRMSTK